MKKSKIDIVTKLDGDWLVIENVITEGITYNAPQGRPVSPAWGLKEKLNEKKFSTVREIEAEVKALCDKIIDLEINIL